MWLPEVGICNCYSTHDENNKGACTGEFTARNTSSFIMGVVILATVLAAMIALVN